jgi:hypothetical protein
MYDTTGVLVGTALVGIIFGVIFAIIICVPLYILTSLGLMKLAERRGIENAWLAWIPIANIYILGKIVKDVDIGKMNINKLEMVLPIALVACWLLGYIPVLGWLIQLAVWVFMIFVFIKLYKMYTPANYVMYTVLSAIMLFGIMIFLIRNNEPVEVPSVGNPIFK